MPDAASTLFRRRLPRRPGLRRLRRASRTPPMIGERFALAKLPTPHGSKFARDLSARARASGLPGSRTRPAAHIRRQSAAASVLPDTGRAGLSLPRRRGSNAASAVARVASRPVPYRERDRRASYAVLPSALLRATADSFPDALCRAGPGSWHLLSLAALPCPRSTPRSSPAARIPAYPTPPASLRRILAAQFQ